MSTRRISIVSIPLALLAVAVGPGGSASAGVVGLERVSPASAATSANKGVTAICPSGKRVLGAGGDTTPGFGDVLLDDIRPSADLTRVVINAREDEDGTAADWFVQAFIVCGYPPAGLERVAATSPLNSSNKEVVASCPAGKKLLGSGAEVNSPNGQVTMEDIRPLSGLTGVAVKGAEDETGVAGNWSLTAYAICSNPVQGLVRVSVKSAVDSAEPKEVNPACPTGKHVIGMGGDINTSNGQVVLDAVFPNLALTNGGFSAWEDDTGNTGNWSLTGYAICVASMERQVTQSSTSSPEVHVVSDLCSGDRVTTGVGGDITGALGQVFLTHLSPHVGPTEHQHVMVAAEDQSATSANWYPRLYGICSTPLPGREVVSGTSASTSSDSKAQGVVCPTGKRVVGAGAGVAIPSGFGQVPLTGIVPNASLSDVLATASEDADGTSENWDLTAYAVCASPPPGLQLVTATSEIDLDELKVVTATCPSGKHLLGVGGALRISSGFGKAGLDDVRANPQLTAVTVTAIEVDGTLDDLDWGVAAYAICVNQ